MTFVYSQVFLKKNLKRAIHWHKQIRSQKRKLTIFGNTKQVIQDYDRLGHSI